MRPVAAGEHLVRIPLVPDVPHELVARRVEAVVQRDRQLDDAESGADVAAGHASTTRSGTRARRRRARAARRCESARMSAGEWMRSRRLMHGACDGATVRKQGHARRKHQERAARIDELRATTAPASSQRRAQDPASRERRARLVAQPLRARPRPVQPEQRRIGALPQRRVAPGGLAQLVGRGRHVEHVVGDLEGEPDGRAVALEARASCRRRRARPRARRSRTDARISAPVFTRCTRSSSASASGAPFALRDRATVRRSCRRRRTRASVRARSRRLHASSRPSARPRRCAARAASGTIARPAAVAAATPKRAVHGRAGRGACRRRPCTGGRRARASRRAPPRPPRRARSRRPRRPRRGRRDSSRIARSRFPSPSIE